MPSAKRSVAEFKLSITKALVSQLMESFKNLEPAPLNSAKIAEVPTKKGVYQLYLRDTLVYVGKADKSLRDRLQDHMRKIAGRQSIDLADMTFAALCVEEDLAAIAPERMLIDHYQADGKSPWNYTGFGRKDPGRQRDTTKVDKKDFDALYPIRLDWPCDELAGDHLVIDLLKTLKEYLPYRFRYHKAQASDSKQPHELREAKVHVPSGSTADDVFRAITEALSTDWQITAFPGYVIMYPETKTYPAATRSYHL